MVIFLSTILFDAYEVQVGNSGKHGKSCLGNAAVGHNAVAVSGFVMVQAFHQLVVILQTALAIFRAADQFCGGQHLVP